MSTWTYKVTAVLIAALLAGCDQFDFPMVSRQAPSVVKLSDGMVVAAADGWCIDERSSRFSSEPSVVVLANCVFLSRGSQAPQPDVRGIVTVSIEDPDLEAPDADTLLAFFKTNAGQAALARNGDPKRVEIIRTEKSDDIVYVHAKDLSPFDANVSQEQWRALFSIGGRFMSVSLVGPRPANLSSSEGFLTLDAQIAQLRLANR
ncbi:MAG: hypothetical protein OXQ92_12915 [Boseongicola sp.]|nr:hypothetical protein [Boseongicola sp.]MDD9976804.1 hypothetical protein [Boseongicola sp.]